MTFTDCKTIAVKRFGEENVTAFNIGIIAGENGVPINYPWPIPRHSTEFERGKQQGRRNAERRAPKQGVLI